MITTPSSHNDHAQLVRILEITGASQLRLAAMPGMNTSSRSLKAREERRRRILAEWPTILSAVGVNPEWIATGDGPVYLHRIDDPALHIQVSRSIPHGFASEVPARELLDRAARDR